VLLRGIKVRVVAHVDGQLERDVGPQVECSLLKGRVVAQLGRVVAQKRLDPIADGRPGRRVERHELVQGGLCKGAGVPKSGEVEDALFTEHSEVEHVVTNSDAHTRNR